MNHNTPARFLGSVGLAALFIACGSRSLTRDNSDYSGSGSGSTASPTAGGSGGLSSGSTVTSTIPGSGGFVIIAGGTGAGGTGTGGRYIPPPPAGPFAEDFPPIGAQAISEANYTQLTTAIKQFCNGTGVEAEADPSAFEFLVDVSSSMLAVTPATGGLSKWDVTREAIKTAVQHLPPTVEIGIAFFPNMDAVASDTPRPTAACVDSSRDVAIAKATTDQVAQILSTLDSVEPFPIAATPTFEAYSVAVDQLLNADVSGKKHIVLITDGQPTQGEGCIGSGSACDLVTPTPVGPITIATNLAYLDHQISTFVIGSPGSEKVVCTGEDPRPWLSETAFYGNRGAPDCSILGPNFCHFDLSGAADFGTALGDTLQNVTRSLIPCTYELPVPLDPNQSVDVATTSMLYSTGTGEYFLLLPSRGGCALGWSFTDETHSMVQICGPTCEFLQDYPAGRLTILFGCSTEPSETP